MHVTKGALLADLVRRVEQLEQRVEELELQRPKKAAPKTEK